MSLNPFKSRGTIPVLLVGLVGVLLVLHAWRLPPFTTTEEVTDNAYVRGLVTVISPQVAGYITEIPVQDYMDVKQGALLVRAVLDDLGLEGAVKTSGAKGVHVFVPVDASVGLEEAAAATRAIADRAARLDPDVATTAFIKDDREGKVFVDPTRVGSATVVAAYSPRIRPGLPVSFPVSWDDLPDVHPRDFTVATAPDLLAGGDPWAAALPAPQELPAELVEHGHTIPVARVAAMHEGKRRKRAKEA